MAAYILFAGSSMVATKGFETVKGVFGSIDDAKAYYTEHELIDSLEWGQIVDFSARIIVSEYKHIKMWKDR